MEGTKKIKDISIIKQFLDRLRIEPVTLRMVVLNTRAFIYRFGYISSSVIIITYVGEMEQSIAKKGDVCGGIFLESVHVQD